MRLRRLCERKPSGRLNVPEAVHKQWAAGGPGKDQLLQQLTESGFNKDAPQFYALPCVTIPTESPIQTACSAGDLPLQGHPKQDGDQHLACKDSPGMVHRRRDEDKAKVE